MKQREHRNKQESGCKRKTLHRTQADRYLGARAWRQYKKTPQAAVLSAGIQRAIILSLGKYIVRNAAHTVPLYAWRIGCNRGTGGKARKRGSGRLIRRYEWRWRLEVASDASWVESRLPNGVTESPALWHGASGAAGAMLTRFWQRRAGAPSASESFNTLCAAALHALASPVASMHRATPCNASVAAATARNEPVSRWMRDHVHH